MEATRERKRRQEPPSRAGEQGRRRGHFARRPREIPPKGWWDIVRHVKEGIGRDNISIVAAGVAFYAFLAIFPALAALVSIYGLVVSPEAVRQQLTRLTGVLPGPARQLMEGQLAQIAGGSSGALGWGLVISVLFALWSANKGTKALFKGVSIAYNEEATRGIIKENALTLLFTLGGIAVTIVSMLMVVVVPALIGAVGLPPAVAGVITWLRWPLLGGIALIAFAAVYRYAPVRRRPRWRWVNWGAALATVLWLVASWAFSFYVANFGSYNQTYGSLAAAVILLLWFLLTSFIILLGAEINAQMEVQTRHDTSVGPDRPMGEWGASRADHL
jgi:membrane protein